ncbi:Hypothetical_protein [Hexamita inflata]|uniref:Hypothetical_protein n=1 Tax=Hexamita inflata TaxID=28002 RepID=A0AA86TTP3_9EUKA|nr:Hypothetical protein HINF_LOCUS16079 [Hexamita inflata]CAI9954879.1 Hypothetical protein HINF_LOCUS42524 [Hexamita inflata]
MTVNGILKSGPSIQTSFDKINDLKQFGSQIQTTNPNLESVLIMDVLIENFQQARQYHIVEVLILNQLGEFNLGIIQDIEDRLNLLLVIIDWFQMIIQIQI